MTRKCAWCGRILGQTTPLEDPKTTHTICPGCAAKWLTDAQTATAALEKNQPGPEKK
jgi:hypothetical protein